MEIDNSLVRNDEANEEKISSVRPKSFKDFIGQSDSKNNLIIFAKSAKKRDTAMDQCGEMKNRDQIGLKSFINLTLTLLGLQVLWLMLKCVSLYSMF